MITFKSNSKGTYISKSDEAEFRKYVMTTDEIVNTIITGSTSTIHNEQHHIDVNTQMLRSFFNNPNRTTLRTTLSIFTDFNYGYGIMNGKLIKVIMWLDDTYKLNFAMYNVKEGDSKFKGHIEKIYVQDGDVFIKDFHEAERYLNSTTKNLYTKELNDLENKFKSINCLRTNQKTIVENLLNDYNKAVKKMSELNSEYESVRDSINKLKRKIKME